MAHLRPFLQDRRVPRWLDTGGSGATNQHFWRHKGMSKAIDTFGHPRIPARHRTAGHLSCHDKLIRVPESTSSWSSLHVDVNPFNDERQVYVQHIPIGAVGLNALPLPGSPCHVPIRIWVQMVWNGVSRGLIRVVQLCLALQAGHAL
eukprot:1151495-Pelagomonas_calceolata.AAC.1